MDAIRVGTAKEAVAHSLRTMGIDIGGDKADANSKVVVSGAGGSSVSVGDRAVRYYPWGRNNKMPGEMIELLRSNSNMQNLLKTRADFLFGAGIGVFTHRTDGTDLVLEPSWRSGLQDFFLEKNIDGLADAYYTNWVELANAWIDVSVDKSGDITLEVMDSSMVRSVIPDDNKRVREYVVSTKWDGAGQKKAATYNAFDFGLLKTGKLEMDSLLHLKPVQPGQFYYGHSSWKALEPWIKLDNRIPEFHNNALDTEGNIGMIIRVANKYFSDMLGKYKKKDGSDFTEVELQEQFDLSMNDFLFGSGKRKTITDVCGYDPVSGQLQKFIEFEAVKKGVSGEEYVKLNNASVWAMSNGSQVLGGLSGVSDGKMNSGGGTEIRIGAEFQQYYRTPRERSQFLRVLNLIYRPILLKKGLIGENDYFAHKNILLQTLDTNKSGAKTVNV